MKIEIFEIDFGYSENGSTGDLYFVTKRGNQIIIPDGEYLFEKWCDKHQIVETSTFYPKNDNDLLKEFAMMNRNKWQIEYDANGDYYGNAAEFMDKYTGSLCPVH
jgi:hypothetical protein